MNHSTFNREEISKSLKENPRSSTKIYKTKQIQIDLLYPNVENWKEKIYLLKENLESPPKCSCGKNKMFYRISDGYFETCGKQQCKTKERLKKQEITNIERYGFKNSSSAPEIKKKTKETNLKRYGVSCTFNEVETRKKIKQTLLDKYGIESPLQSAKIQEKRRKTLIENHGTDSMFYSDKYKRVMLERYGHINPMQVTKFAKRVSDTQIQNKLSDVIEKIQNSNKEYLSIDGNRLTIKCNCGNVFSIHRCSLNAHLRNEIDFCQICNPINRFRSKSENDLYLFCLEEFSDLKISTNRRIGGYEIDVFFDDLNIGLEFNGLYWHSEDYKEINYHQKKSEKFESLGINIIQIWEDDWYLKRDIIKNIIRSKIKPIRIGARKFKLKEVNFKEAKEFHEKFHLDGYSVSRIHIGLFLENELVSLTSFGKSRYKNEAEWELIRYTTKDRYSIIGGFSRMLNYFVETQKPKSLKSYKKLDLGYKNFYEDIGFERVKRIGPNFFWIVNNVRINRQNFQKKKLKDIKENQTAVDYMYERGYKRIWDTGSDLFVKIF